MDRVAHRSDPDLKRQRVMRLRDNLLDTDIAVDDARRDLEDVLRRLRSLVHSRDDVARELEALIDDDNGEANPPGDGDWLQ